MKAKFVYENLDFERGRDPKQTIGIGKIAMLEDYEYREKLAKELDDFLGYKCMNYNPRARGTQCDFIAGLKWYPELKKLMIITRYYSYNEEIRDDEIPQDLGKKMKEFFKEKGFSVKKLHQTEKHINWNSREFAAYL